MQRRAAAVYFGLFVLIALGAYAFLQVGFTQPTADFDAEPYAEGGQLTAGGITYTVSSVSVPEGESGSYSATLTFTNQTTGNESEIRASQGGNVTLGGAQHFAYFPSDGGVYVLPTDQFYGQYQEFLDTEDNFGERKAGFWGVVYISVIGAIVLLMSAYMPVKG